MKNFLEDNWFKLALLIIGIFLAYVAYHAVILNPDKTIQDQQELQRKESVLKSNAEVELKNCLRLADINYVNSDSLRGEAKQECYNRYDRLTD